MFGRLSGVFLLFCFLCVGSLSAETVKSPDGRIAVDIFSDGGAVRYQSQYSGKTAVSSSVLGWRTNPAVDSVRIVGSRTRSIDTSWTPKWGEQSVIPDRYNELTLDIQAKSKARSFKYSIELRVYNEGFAFRYVLADRKQLARIEGELTEFNLPKDAVVYPLSSTEATFSDDPTDLTSFKRSYPPLTGKFSDGKAFSIMEACAIGYPRFLIGRNSKGIIAVDVRRTEIEPSSKPFQSAWRLILLAGNEAKLIEQNYLILNLNPESKGNFDWLRPGLTISNEGNCDIRAEALKSMIDFAATNNMKYIQIDWGWYGTEWVYTDAECAEWAKNNPEKAKDPTWRSNTRPTPDKVARGLVPYFPMFKASTYVDVDIRDLVEYGKKKEVGVCLYLNDRMIKTHDIRKLFQLYEDWGLAGLKPGFVAYGSAKNSDELRYLSSTAAAHKLWLCIHDAYLPDGSARTFPNVYSVEGGGGQEGNHPASHDTVLPFTRALTGPFDFTPKFYYNGRSNAHQMSLLVTLYNPAPVLRGGWAIRGNKSGNAFGPEIEFFKYFRASWIKTVVPEAQIGRCVITARQAKDGFWVLGATNGKEATNRSISCSFLTPGQDYRLLLWSDSPEEKDGWRSAVKTVRTIRSTDTLTLSLAANGGAVAAFVPILKGDYWCYFGTYTGSMNEEMRKLGSIKPEGILAARFDTKTGKFSSPCPVATINNPSWLTLAPNGKTAYSVGEGSPANGTANVTAYRINPKDGSLTLLNKVGTGGGSPCHLAISSDGKYLIASNYGGGDFVFYRLREDGSLDKETARYMQKATGVLFNGKPRVPHGHSASFSLQEFNGKYRVYLCDLGNDRVHVGFLDKASGKFEPDPNIAGLDTKLDAGPRHLVVYPVGKSDLVLTINENGSSLNVFRVGEKQAESLGDVFSLPAEFKGKVTWRKNLVDGKKYTLYNATAEILFDSEKKHVYITNRGHDSIGVFDFDPNGRTAADILKLKQIVPTGGSFPRNIELDPSGRFLIVSNQLSGTIFTFHRDKSSGKLTLSSEKPLLIGNPLAILFVPAVNP